MATKTSTTSKSAAPAVECEVFPDDLHAHLWRVRMRIAKPARQQSLSLPVWIAGSYMVREFSKHVQNLTAQQGDKIVSLSQVTKNTWLASCKAGVALELEYEVYALDNSVRTAWLDTRRGFFNGTSLFFRAHGCEHLEHRVQLHAPGKQAQGRWKVATGLEPLSTDVRGFGTYSAINYDELADCPVEMGEFWSGELKACGVKHQFVVAGAPAGFDGKRLLADTKRICEAAIQFWDKAGVAPMKRYVFMLNAVAEGYGGLEHRNSTALIAARKDLPREGDDALTLSDGYVTLLGLISHEYFHTWNVKRLRPAEFAEYDFEREQYTQLLWFFEGFTSYYDDVLLVRAGLIDVPRYLKLLQKTLGGVLQTPGRWVQSVAQSSFDAWVKYYRQDENTPNSTVSYYTKGSLVALCFDLSLRQSGHSLDDVMRLLWQRLAPKANSKNKALDPAARPMTEADFAQALADVSGRSWRKEIESWVHGTGDLPVADLLLAHGVAHRLDDASFAASLGLKAQESGGLMVQTVLRGSVAERAGFCPKDEWLAVASADAHAATNPKFWRIQKLDDVLTQVRPGQVALALVSRDQQLQTLRLQLPKKGLHQLPRLGLDDVDAAKRWLNDDVVMSQPKRRSVRTATVTVRR
jgi:predicted metalloprotease with PDZ domain